VDHLKSGKRFSKASIAITFDDGYLDNYTLAYPVLRKYRVPAMIYITTGVMGTSEGTWPDLIEHALLETQKEQFSLQGLFGHEIVKIKTINEKEKANIRITEALKLRPDFERKELMEGLLKNLRVDINHVNNERPRIMLNWDEIKEMAKNGITIGSHSHTHPILSRMPLQKAKEDIFTSKKIIEENLCIKVKHFAYPNGRGEDFSEELRNYCKEIGFESVASLIHGTNNPSNGNTFALKRIGATSPVWMLAGELVRLFWKDGIKKGFQKTQQTQRTQ
jgi:peptidoglycan/xylan/chitin deacetylase (PgdA/CDA1 family)